MAAPFSGEDLFKRSLIGSILGFKIKTPKFQHQQQQGQSNVRQHPSTAPHFNYDQPCSSKTVLQLDAQRRQTFVSNSYAQSLPPHRQQHQQQHQQHPHRNHLRQQQHQDEQQQQQLPFHKHQNLTDYGVRAGLSAAVDNDAEHSSYGGRRVGGPTMTTAAAVVENVSLSDQLSESLFLASPQALTPTSQFSADAQAVSYHPLVSSPHDIYQEIVYECEPFLGKQQFGQLDQSLLTSNSESLIENEEKISGFGAGIANISSQNPYLLQMENESFPPSVERPLSAYPHATEQPNPNFAENNMSESSYYSSQQQQQQQMATQQQQQQQSYCMPNTTAVPSSLLPDVPSPRVRHPTVPMMKACGYGMARAAELQNPPLSLDGSAAENAKMVSPPSYDHQHHHHQQQQQHLPFPDEQLYYDNQDRKLSDAAFFAGDNPQQPTPLPPQPAHNETDYFVGSNFDSEDSFMKSAAEVLASKILLGVEVGPNSLQEIKAKTDELNKEHRQQKLGSILNGQVSLEELVKMVVAAVKEAGGLGGVVTDKERPKLATSPQPQQPASVQSAKRPDVTINGETPEEILQRKRQQNNEAAARYRKRQRSARFIAEDEIQCLKRRNAEIKAEIAMVEHEIEILKEQFTIASPRVPRKRSVKPPTEKIEQTDSAEEIDVEVYPRTSDPTTYKPIIRKN